MVCWWAASEFDLGWAPAEWLESIGLLDPWMGLTGTTERRIAGLGWMLTVWMVGQLCDLLDGAVARSMGAEGPQGAMLDAMADLVSAGLAPAFVGMALMMEWQAMGVMPESMWWATIWPLAVVMAAAWRLARFARLAISGEEDGQLGRFDFAGIPAPYAALFWGGLVWAWLRCDGVGCPWLWYAGLLGATALPVGMASTWPQLGFKHWGQERWWDIARIAWLIGAMTCGVLGGPLGVVLALISYPLFGPATRLFRPLHSH